MSVLLAVLLLLAAAAPPALVEVPEIELDPLEPAVAAQLRALGERLAAARGEGSGDAALYGEAGATYLAYDLNAAAEACYRNAEALAPADFRWPYLLGVVLENRGRLEETAQSLERALAGRDKLYYPALLRLASVDLALGRTDDAAARLDLARRQAAGDPALLALSGELASARGRYAEAIRDLREALRLRPEATRLHYPLAMALRASGQAEAARQHLERAGTAGLAPRDALLEEVQAHRRGSIVWLLEGGRAFAAGNLTGAVTAFRRAVAADPSNVPALVNLAAVEARLGHPAASRRHLERAVELDPANVNANFNLGLLLARQARPAEAEPRLRAALAGDPGDEAARLELALVLGTLSRLPEALDLLEQAAAAVDPGRCAAVRQLLAAARDAGEPLAGRSTVLASRLPQGCRP